MPAPPSGPQGEIQQQEKTPCTCLSSAAEEALGEALSPYSQPGRVQLGRGRRQGWLLLSPTGSRGERSTGHCPLPLSQTRQHPAWGRGWVLCSLPPQAFLRGKVAELLPATHTRNSSAGSRQGTCSAAPYTKVPALKCRT